MRSTTLSIINGKPPSEFRIFTAGQVRTTKGVFVFDDEAAARLMASIAERGVEVPIDFDHAMTGSAPPQERIAAGWFTPEMRDGELWAARVRWTERAAQQIAAGEWRYMSPWFLQDDENRIVGLWNVALTNIPATKDLDPLVASVALAAAVRLVASWPAANGPSYHSPIASAMDSVMGTGPATPAVRLDGNVQRLSAAITSDEANRLASGRGPASALVGGADAAPVRKTEPSRLSPLAAEMDRVMGIVPLGPSVRLDGNVQRLSQIGGKE